MSITFDAAPLGVPGIYWPVPLVPGTKKCLVPGWSSKLPNDSFWGAAWKAAWEPLGKRFDPEEWVWKPAPEGEVEKPNIGYRLDGIGVADCDNAEFVAMFREFAPTPIMSRGRPDRASFWFLASPEMGSFRIPGFEWKTGKGHLVVVPPSIHPDTKEPYQWIGEAGALDPITVSSLPVAPVDLLAEVREMRSSGAVAAGDGWMVQGKGDGRNNYLTGLAGTMRRFGAHPEAVLRQLELLNQSACCPALPEKEIAAIARSAAGWSYDVIDDDDEIGGWPWTTM